MHRNIHVKEAYVGLALALILPTKYRLIDGVGAGEIALLIFSSAVFINALVRRHISIPGIEGRIATTLLFYVFLILLPITVVGIYFDIPGASFRDWLAYALSSAFIAATVITRLNFAAAVRYFITFLIAIILFQYYFGGTGAWYSTRFTAGAINPNQLALYVICGLALSLAYANANWIKIITSAIFVAFGAITGSDALIAATMAVVVSYIACTALPKRTLLILSPIIIGLFLWLFIRFEENLISWLGSRWAVADEGGSRYSLYINGIKSWLNSPFTILIGNGAGSFSGLTLPYEAAESHNTPIDMLSVGGLIGLIVCYWVFPLVITRAYAKGDSKTISILIGLLVFSLFHFVTRQPIWWFSIIAISHPYRFIFREKGSN